MTLVAVQKQFSFSEAVSSWRHSVNSVIPISVISGKKIPGASIVWVHSHASNCLFLAYSWHSGPEIRNSNIVYKRGFWISQKISKIKRGLQSYKNGLKIYSWDHKKIFYHVNLLLKLWLLEKYLKLLWQNSDKCRKNVAKNRFLSP